MAQGRKVLSEARRSPVDPSSFHHGFLPRARIAIAMDPHQWNNLMRHAVSQASAQAVRHLRGDLQAAKNVRELTSYTIITDGGFNQHSN